MSTERDLTRDLLRMSAYATLAQFWTALDLKAEIWEEDAKDLLLLQKALIEELENTLKPYLDETSMKRFRDYVDRFRARIVFTEGAKARRFHKK